MMALPRSAAILFLILLCVPASAQTQAPNGFADRWAVQPAAAATKKASEPIGIEQTLYLIRSSLLTLNDANRSGNYSVLRDLAAPDFQAKNSAADLAMIFSDLRARKVDLFAVALVAPKLSAPPALDANKMLRLTGSFPTTPLRIDFDLRFQNVGGFWLLYGVSVATPKAVTSSAAPPQAANH